MSDKQAIDSQHPLDTQINYGGQAVIEGVMMRGSQALSVAVRNPGGDIVVHTEPLDARIYGGRMARIPFLRGLTLLWDALGLGIKALMFSAEVAIEEEDEESEAAVAGAQPGAEAGEVFAGPVKWTMIALSLSMMVGLFFVLPAFLAGMLEGWLGFESPFWGHLFEGFIRLAFVVGYIWAIGFMPDVKRLYGYHGAEHKTINAYEAGAELTPQEVAKFPLEHPRCGTAFLLTVVVISIIIYTLLPPMSLGVRILSRLLLLPIIAGISYEFLRFSAAHQDNAVIRLITKPNLALQRLTTREPDLSMLEVAITAFKQVVGYEAGEPVVEGTQVITATEPAEGILAPALPVESATD